MIIRMLKALLLPLARAQAIRRDDRAQVMVITAVMVFVAAIFTVQLLNTSTMIFNRIRSQNAADAAADAFALWQARGVNAMQHINDAHYDIDMIAYWVAMPSCTARLGCVFLNAIPFVGPALYQACCAITLVALSGAEIAQSLAEGLSLSVQWFIKYFFPVFGIIRANSVAEGNGADPLIGSILSTAQGLVNHLGVGGLININGALAALNAIPGVGDIYALPLGVKQAYPLHVRPRIPTKGGMPWEVSRTFVNLCKNAGCPVPVVCRGNNSKSNPPGLMALSQELQLGIKAFTGSDCGWDDTYYYGYPGFNTWIAGLQSKDAVVGLTHNPWLNPMTSLSSPEKDVTYRGVLRGRSKFQQVGRSLQPWQNPGFVGWASSQIEGDPVMESSDNNWKVSRPKLITVHIPKYSTEENANNNANNGAEDLEPTLIYH